MKAFNHNSLHLYNFPKTLHATVFQSYGKLALVVKSNQHGLFISGRFASRKIDAQISLCNHITAFPHRVLFTAVKPHNASTFRLSAVHMVDCRKKAECVCFFGLFTNKFQSFGTAACLIITLWCRMFDAATFGIREEKPRTSICSCW